MSTSGRTQRSAAARLHAVYLAARAYLLAVVVVIAATLLRLALGHWVPGLVPFAVYFPALLLITVFAGWQAGVLGLLLSVLLSWYPGVEQPGLSNGALVNTVLFAACGGLFVAIGSVTRSHLGRFRQMGADLGQREMRYKALFGTMAEGFALVEAIWSDDGKLIDYRIVEMNPALQRMLGVGQEAVGTKLTDAGGAPVEWLALCERVLKTGENANFAYHNPATDRWHDIQLTRISADEVGQFFHDITERKRAEERQARLFDELNHRVKNNIALVAGLLRMQSNNATPEVQAELLKAVNRMQSVSEVHNALYRGGQHSEVDFAVYVKDLCGQLQKSLVDPARVNITVEADPLLLPIDTVIPLGMITNEIVSNSAKHAFAGGARGTIRVTFRSGPKVQLSVSDDGKGLRPEDLREEASLGLRLVRGLVEQLKGTLAIAADGGTRFVVEFEHARVAGQLFESPVA